MIWLFLILLAVILVRAVRDRDEVLQTEALSEGVAASAFIEPEAQATDFDDVSRQIDALWGVGSPALGRVEGLGETLCRAYASHLTGAQQMEIERTLPKALVGKRVAWELIVDDVRERDGCFVPGDADAGGFLLRLVTSLPLLVVECQTPDASVLRLRPGQPVIASGRVVYATIPWPSVALTMTGAVVEPNPHGQEVKIRDAVTAAAPAVPAAPALPVAPAVPAPAPNPELPEVPIDNAEPSREPSYQTAPLAAYSKGRRERAEELFEAARRRLGRNARKCKGSFSIAAASSSETAAKIVIYERGLGRENGEWPALEDGIYILIRRNGTAGRAIWRGGVPGVSACHHRLGPTRTLGIAPRRDERFAYFRLEPGDETQDIVDLLVTCSLA